jgi:large subunit ribosomal protein L49
MVATEAPAATVGAVKSSPKALRRSPEAPTSTKDAARAADLAAAEAATDADNPTAPAPKPALPSKRPASSSPKAAEAPATASDALSHLTPAKANTSTGGRKDSRPRLADGVQRPVRDALDEALDAGAAQKTGKPRTFKAPSNANNTPKASPSAAQKISLELPPPKYHVARSSSNNLPIYSDFKRGGNLHLTTVRKITGDLSALRDELRVFLNKKNEDVKINSLTQHVIVKGHHVPQVTEFLRARGM